MTKTKIYWLPDVKLEMGVRSFEDGKIQSGYVINGNWNFVRLDEYCYALNVSNGFDVNRGYVNRWKDDGTFDRFEELKNGSDTHSS